MKGVNGWTLFQHYYWEKGGKAKTRTSLIPSSAKRKSTIFITKNSRKPISPNFRQGNRGRKKNFFPLHVRREEFFRFSPRIRRKILASRKKGRTYTRFQAIFEKGRDNRLTASKEGIPSNIHDSFMRLVGERGEEELSIL